jgi:hypothetical protein
MSKPDKVKVEVNKRHDKKYNVWQYFTVSDAIRHSELRGIFHQFFDSSDFDNGEKMEQTHSRIIGRWILVSVQRNKKEATEFCKKTWGRKCFKGNNELSVTYV